MIHISTVIISNCNFFQVFVTFPFLGPRVKAGNSRVDQSTNNFWLVAY